MRIADWIFAVLLVVAYFPALVSMSEVWSRLDYYSHGYLVPAVALWAASGQRHLLPGLPVSREPWGLLGVGAALIFYLIGLSSGVVSLQGVSLVLAVASALYYLRGAAWLRALLFPVAYLLFMVPIPSAWLAPVIVRLQLAVSAAAVWLMQMAGVAVVREGNVIDLPGVGALFVAEACSGITSIITLTPLAVLLAYFTERSLARRLVLVAAVFPLAMLGNLVRVVGTIVAAREFGVEAATEGLFHGSTGLLTYVLGCLALLGVGALMRTLAPEKSPPGTP